MDRKTTASCLAFLGLLALLVVTQLRAGRPLVKKVPGFGLVPAPPPSPARVVVEANWPVRDEPAPDVAPPPPAAIAVASAPPVERSAPEFSAEAARLALGPGLESLPVCRVQGGAGPGAVEVVWAPDGRVARVAVSEPFAGNPAGACIARRFVGARVPAFAGGPQAMRVSFRI